MKIAILGLDFPLGKKSLSDEKWEKIREIFHARQTSPIQIEFLDASHLKDSDGIIAEKDSQLDLIIADLEIIENQLAKKPDDALLLRCKDSLDKEIILNEVPFNEEEKKFLVNINLVTLKPILLVDKENLPPIPEIMRSIFSTCGMISFFTVNERELRAWQIRKGTTIYEAAGSIHSDIQRGFIKAEVIGYEDLVKSGGINQARSKGLVRLEDKSYIVKDGDLIQIRFNV